jgi:hypothetical protein
VGPRWSDSVVELLDAIGQTAPTLATEAGLDRKTVYRYLNAGRRPNPDLLAQINAAIASLAGLTSVADYLDAVAGLQWADHGEHPLYSSKVLKIIASDLDGYLKNGYLPWLYDELVRLALPVSRRLLLALLRDYFKRILRQIDGAIPREPAIDAVIRTFQAHGIQLNEWLRPEDELMVRRDLCQFEMLVADALGKVANDPDRIRTRMIQESRIMSAYTDMIVKLTIADQDRNASTVAKIVKRSVEDMERTFEAAKKAQVK